SAVTACPSQDVGIVAGREAHLPGRLAEVGGVLERVAEVAGELVTARQSQPLLGGQPGEAASFCRCYARPLGSQAALRYPTVGQRQTLERAQLDGTQPGGELDTEIAYLAGVKVPGVGERQPGRPVVLAQGAEGQLH